MDGPAPFRQTPGGRTEPRSNASAADRHWRLPGHADARYIVSNFRHRHFNARMAPPPPLPVLSDSIDQIRTCRAAKPQGRVPAGRIRKQDRPGHRRPPSPYVAINSRHAAALQ